MTSTPNQPGNNPRKRYALVGTGGRAWMFIHAICTAHRDEGELVALCDVNQTRMDFYNREVAALLPSGHIPTYLAENFEQMLSETKPDTVIVTSIDRTHHLYIIRALELGCDVIAEKPLTIDIESCRAILEAVERTGRKLTVTFNYRYAPISSKVKEMVDGGAIGEVKSIHFEWLLDTRHGADYFRRWHRQKRNSGGLMVHKATHHFDLVNWWLDSSPQTIFAFGNLGFYGRENARQRGVVQTYERGTDTPAAAGDPFALDLRSSDKLRRLYLEAEHEDGYKRDLNVFGEGIDIEDTMNVLVRYKSGVQMSYSLHAYAPWEGYRIALNGTGGRIEVTRRETPYINAGNGNLEEGKSSFEQILLLPHFAKPQEVEIPAGEGGHGGGDPIMLAEIFGRVPAVDRLNRAANHIDGVRSILTGIAANECMATGQPVNVDDLLQLDDPARASA